MRLLVFNMAMEPFTRAFILYWVKALAKRMERIHVITMSMGQIDVPENVRVYSMGKEKEIIDDYKKRMQDLVISCRRAATLFADPIKKEKVNQLEQLGLDVFKALEKLEKANSLGIKCNKCGSMAKCSRCRTKITLF